MDFEYILGSGWFIFRLSHSSSKVSTSNKALEDRNPSQPEPEKRFDSTGMFHWCTPQSIENCIIVSVACQVEFHAFTTDFSKTFWNISA